MSKGVPVDAPVNLLRDLLGVVCFACGKRKGCGKSLCRNCFFSLPVPARNALYNRMGEGYEEAYADALRLLPGGSRGSVAGRRPRSQPRLPGIF
jgi:hypothetical protein